MIYTIWFGESVTIVPGVNAPVFDNGVLQDLTARKVHEFAAMNQTEAYTRLHEFMGWEPYKA